jgi:hypothetical protein
MVRTANIHHLVFCAICHKSVIHFLRLWQFAQWLAYRSWHKRRVKAKAAGSGDPVFTSMDALLYGT